MASSPNVDGMVDIRSYAILQDVWISQHNCLTKEEVGVRIRSPFYRQITNLSPFIVKGQDNELPRQVTVLYDHRSSENVGLQAHEEGEGQQQQLTSRPPFFEVEEEEIDPETSKYDNEYSWTCCFCSVAIVFVIFGTIFSYAALHLQIRLTYGLSYTESILTGAGCFAIFVIVGPLTTCVIKSLGYRSTAIFGLLLVFIGLILEGCITNVILFYTSRLVLIPIGGGFAHTASHYMSSFFEQQILYAVLLLCCSSVLGVIIYTWFSILLQSVMTYKGIQVVFGLVVLSIMTVTHAFPRKMNKQVTEERTRNQALKQCIKSNVRADVLERAGKDVTDYDEDATVELKSCLCVCVCEWSTVCDRGFFLWAGITMMASLTVTVPYLFLYLFHLFIPSVRVSNSPLKLFLAFSVPNLLARIFLIIFDEHTYSFNRNVFQLSLAGTGVFMICVSRIETFAWLLIWMLGMGAFQGLMSVTIPRVTLQAVQRKWLKRAWILIITLDAIGSLIGPILMLTLRHALFTVEFRLPTVVIGVAQVVAVVLAFLVPNDEINFKAVPPPKVQGNDVPSSQSFQPRISPTAPIASSDWTTLEVERSRVLGSPFPGSMPLPRGFMDNNLNRQIPPTIGLGSRGGGGGGGGWESNCDCDSYGF